MWCSRWILPKRPGLLVRAGGEEQRVGRPVVREAALAELERPQAVDQDRLVIGTPERTDTLVAPVRLRLVGVDLAVAEVADEEIAAEGAEVRRSPSQAPRRVQLATGRDAPEKVSVVS